MKKKQEEKLNLSIEAVLGLFGLLLVIIAGLFNLTGTAISGGILVFLLTYKPKGN